MMSWRKARREWIDLPSEITANILRRLGPVDILTSAENVCTTWREICHDPSMWRVIYLEHPCTLELGRRAVVRSQGQLVDLTIDDLGDNSFLHYIVRRARGLKRMTLYQCNLVTGAGLATAVVKLPHLEELHLIYMTDVYARSIADIGVFCPNLKSFSYFRYGYGDEPNRNHRALAIANFMPNLRYLSLIVGLMDNYGLEAILNGCPNLETLDLRMCSNLEFEGHIEERCFQQIRYLKTPRDFLTGRQYLKELMKQTVA